MNLRPMKTHSHTSTYHHRFPFHFALLVLIYFLHKLGAPKRITHIFSIKIYIHQSKLIIMHAKHQCPICS